MNFKVKGLIWPALTLLLLTDNGVAQRGNDDYPKVQVTNKSLQLSPKHMWVVLAPDLERVDFVAPLTSAGIFYNDLVEFHTPMTNGQDRFMIEFEAFNVGQAIQRVVWARDLGQAGFLPVFLVKKYFPNASVR